VNFPLRKLDPQATDAISDDRVTLCLQGARRSCA